MGKNKKQSRIEEKVKKVDSLKIPGEFEHNRFSTGSNCLKIPLERSSIYNTSNTGFFHIPVESYSHRRFFPSPKEDYNKRNNND